MNEVKRKERELLKSLSKMNYTGQITNADEDVYGTKVIKIVTKKFNNKNKTYAIVYEIRTHQISLPFREDTKIEELLCKGRNIAKQILDDELAELIEKYIEITIDDLEISSLYDNWAVLTRDDGSVYKNLDGNIILVKYYRVTPNAEFLSKYHTVEELKLMSKKEN